MKVAEGGAGASKSSLFVSGKCEGAAQMFAGVMYTPGDVPMQPADLSAYGGFSFWVRSDKPGNMNCLMFSKSGGFQPAVKIFEATDEWKNIKIQFTELNGSDGSDVNGLWWGSNAAGEFEFSLDDLRLLKGNN